MTIAEFRRGLIVAALALIRPDRAAIPGQHFHLDCKELPGA